MAMAMAMTMAATIMATRPRKYGRWAAFRGPFAGALVLTLGACANTADGAASTAMDDQTEFTDFATLEPPSSPNAWLIAPADSVGGEPDEPAPVFPVPAAALAKEWTVIVEQQPRAKIRAVSADGLQVEAEQRSAVFGFVDRISVRFIPLDPERSTLAAYSRAQMGYWDFGVNRQRLHDWLMQLEEQTTTEDATAGEGGSD